MARATEVKKSSVPSGEEEAAAEHEGGAHEEAEAPKLDTTRLLYQIINFSILAGVLGWFGGRAINKALLARHQQLKADLAAAAEARTAAEARALVQQKRLETLETEIANIRASIKQEAEDEKQRLIATAEERARSIAQETTFLLDQQVKEAEIALKREVAEAAVRIAEAIVTKSLHAGDQQKLVETFVSGVAGPRAGWERLMAAMAGSVSRRYARALFSIGVDRGNFAQLGKELDAVAELWDGAPELREALANPVFKASEKRAVMQSLLPRVAPTADVQKFVLLLLERRRLPAVAHIARAYREMADLHTGRVRAQITSAQPLGPAELERVKQSLARRTGKQVIVEASVDPALIGGIVARVGDLVLDGSVRTQLGTLRDKLLN